MFRFALHLLIGIPAGLFAANASEWAVHKYVLHGLGRHKDSFWAFHWHDHHRAARKHGMYDAAYATPWRSEWNARSKEALSLVLATAPWALLLPIVPGFSAAVLYSNINYYLKHRRAHLDPAWANENLPWHVDHHLGPDQDANWCVTKPWFDILMGTRVPRTSAPEPRVSDAPTAV
jgi:sterol desaturase/sphingolipid hydroxylase (fatty acid hydroxylase superfamily)